MEEKDLQITILCSLIIVLQLVIVAIIYADNKRWKEMLTYFNEYKEEAEESIETLKERIELLTKLNHQTRNN